MDLDLATGSIQAKSIRTHKQGFHVEICPEACLILNLALNLVQDFVLSSIREHQRLLSLRAASILKNAPESAVTLVKLSGFPAVCVKEFRWRGFCHGIKGLFRPTQGRRTFTNGRRLNQARVSAAYPLALIRKMSLGIVITEWIVMEVVPNSLELDRYILDRIALSWTTEEKRGLARALGRFVGSMHSRGVFHSDLKTCNILVSKDRTASDKTTIPDYSPATHLHSAVRFVLMDYDDVRFSHSVSLRSKVKNLVQIFLSTPLAVNMSDRFRFLDEYALNSGISPGQKRQIARQVLRSVGNKDILYVGPNGDIREKWYA